MTVEAMVKHLLNNKENGKPCPDIITVQIGATGYYEYKNFEKLVAQFGEKTIKAMNAQDVTCIDIKL